MCCLGNLDIPKTDYSHIAEYYDRVRTVPIDAWLSKIVQYAEIDASSVVLDVGCGTGRFPLRISTLREPAIVCALEPSIEMLRGAVAKDKSKNVSWVRGDGQQLPFKENLFDCIYMTMVLHHIDNKDMALQEILRALKKSGKCVIMTTSHSRIRKHVLNVFPGVTAIDLKRFPSVPSIKNAMTRIGFKNICYHTFKRYEETSTDEYLEKVRNKYISTLTLLSEDAFQKGFKVFERKLRKKHRYRFRRTSGFVFVVSHK